MTIMQLQLQLQLDSNQKLKDMQFKLESIGPAFRLTLLGIKK